MSARPTPAAISRRIAVIACAGLVGLLAVLGTATAADLTPNDPKFASQYAPQLTHAPAAWSTTLGAKSATICFLDTGVRRTHEDLAANYAGGIDLVNKDSDPQDDRGHGTKTAGIAAAVINNGKGISGMANVPFKEVKVISASGVVPTGAVATGIRWCADNGARIISISLGGNGADPAVLEAVEYAWSKGLLLVAGTGNGACDNCVLYPAAFDHVIAVGCVDSKRVPCADQSKGPQVDLAAPGVNVLTTGYGSDSSYVIGGGTSASAPHVAGAAALVWSAHPEYTNAKVWEVLVATAEDVGAAGRDQASGAGLVRPDLAIASGTAPPPTAFTATFTVSPNVNEWWVEVRVSSSSAPAAVTASVNDGPAVALEKKSWGAWAKSFNVPRGSSVVFRATDGAGHVAVSPAVTWMGSSFAAQFTPRTQTNEWWIDVRVTANEPIKSVDARLNGGAWTALTATEWGTYAKGIHAVEGTKVEFRATSTSGASVISAPYTWG